MTSSGSSSNGSSNNSSQRPKKNFNTLLNQLTPTVQNTKMATATVASENTQQQPATPMKRFTTKELAQLEVYGRMGKVFCRMSNLSKSGAFFEIINSNFNPKVGDLVRITVLLRQINKTHIIDAEVVWSRGLGLGLCFIKKNDLVGKLSSKMFVS